jgi:hypothetical protein
MTAKTLLWRNKEVSANASVAASKAAAASAWSLWGAIAIGAAIGASVLAFKNAFAKGVENFKGGLALVGEKGPELVNLPRGSSVFSNEKSMNMLATAGGGSINIDLRGSVFSSKRAYKDLEDSLFRVIKNNRKI